MSTEDRVRAKVAEYVWRSNPHSVSLAASCLKLAALADAGHNVTIPLDRALSHLADCSPGDDDFIDELRARLARRAADVISRF